MPAAMFLRIIPWLFFRVDLLVVLFLALLIRSLPRCQATAIFLGGGAWGCAGAWPVALGAVCVAGHSCAGGGQDRDGSFHRAIGCRVAASPEARSTDASPAQTTGKTSRACSAQTHCPACIAAGSRRSACRVAGGCLGFCACPIEAHHFRAGRCACASRWARCAERGFVRGLSVQAGTRLSCAIAAIGGNRQSCLARLAGQGGKCGQSQC